MQKVIIDNLIVPTIEVIAKVVANPSIKVASDSDLWVKLAAIGTFGTLVILGFAEIVKIVQWYKEHIALNRNNRYAIESCYFNWEHNSDELANKIIFGDIDLRYEFMSKLGLFCAVPAKGVIYAFMLINKGTTLDYIYKATIDNNKGGFIDISVGHILGSNFLPEILPRNLTALQGDVWIVGIEDKDFLSVNDPVLTVYTSAGVYKLKIDDSMKFDSFGKASE